MLKGFYDIGNIRIGITAGASTPAHIIKEVNNQMSEKLQNVDEDFNFEEAIEASFKRLYTGNRVKGYITAVNNTEAIVDIGTKQTGYVSLDELTDDPALKPADVVKVGDEVEFIVLKVNDAEGYITLSKKKVDAMVGFDKIVKAKEENTVLDGVVVDVVKGGVLALTNGIKVFIPASQATMRRDEKLEDLKKKEVKFKIIEVNEQRGKAVGSIKAVLSAEREAARAKFWETVKVGDKFKGEVKSITNYGAFVDLGGIDGMVHISELSWNRIKHPSEVVSVGDVLEVYVKELDKEANRISLGYKKDEDNPFVKFSNEYKEGDVVDVKVVSITPFGAFAQIIPGIDGLIHISQISDKRVTNVKDVLSVGDEVKVKITEIDSEKKRISLSIRAVLEDSADSDAE
jgi:4-hydroxy-3-methylbut-2-enyl diphosphate reductase